jgi:hypothetical protein
MKSLFIVLDLMASGSLKNVSENDERRDAR